MKIATSLFEYFTQNWNRDPYPIIDHSLRCDLMPDGRFHFYIHASNASSTTTDFYVDPSGLVTFANDRYPDEGIDPDYQI